MCGVNEIAKGIGETVPEIYHDGLQSSVKEVGEILALPLQAINAALSPLHQWIAQRKYNAEETKKLLAQKLEKVDVNKIVSPEPYIAVPALQAISYSMNSDELRNLYANLLATSMISDEKWNVHPSFVEIIKQLSPDEAKLLRTLTKDNYPIIDLKLRHPNRKFNVVLQNFTDIADEICEHPEKITAYLDNIERLKLIEIPFGVYIADDSIYKHLEEHSDIKAVKEFMANRVGKEDKWEFTRKKFQLTQYGKAFINVCVVDK